jgi:hypothetical protein
MARRLAAAYAEDPQVTGVLCAGSTGRGHADRWSDLELLVLWAAAPTDEARRRVPDALRGTAIRLFGYEPAEFSRADDFWLAGEPGAGLLVEVGHSTVREAGGALDRLLVDLVPDPYLLTVASAYADGTPLYGDLAGLPERVATYPPELARTVAGRLGQIDNFWRWRMYLDRGEPYGLSAHFAAVAGAVVQMACAINGRYWPGAKWARHTLASLERVPDHAVQRLSTVDTIAPASVAAELAGLVEESYDLVETYLDGVDVARLRRIFRFGREPWPR